MLVNCPSCGEHEQDDRTGDPPVCMGCGQMLPPDPEELYKIIKERDAKIAEMWRALEYYANWDHRYLPGNLTAIDVLDDLREGKSELLERVRKLEKMYSEIKELSEKYPTLLSTDLMVILNKLEVKDEKDS